MLWPWISRSWHREVIEAHKALEATLHEEVAYLKARLERPIAVTVELPKDFAVIQQAVVEAPPKRRKKQDPIAARIDYAEVDESDPVQLSTIVNYHLGPRAATANRYERRQVLSGVITQIRAAKEERLRERAVAVENRLPAQDVPQHILEMVNSAEKGE